MADNRKDEDWRWRDRGGPYTGQRFGRNDQNRSNSGSQNYGSQGAGYPDDVDAGYGASRGDYGNRGDWTDNDRSDNGFRNTGRDWDRNDRQDNRGSSGSRYGSDVYGETRFTTDPDQSPSTYRNRVGRGGYGGGERNWVDKAGDAVSSWLGNDDASQRREEDKRRDGHYGRGPKGYRRSDARIAEDVNDKLTDDWRLDASEISVEVKEGEVTLAGAVQSREDKRRAEDLAHDVSGVTHVQNNLRVVTATGVGNGMPGASFTAGRSSDD